MVAAAAVNQGITRKEAALQAEKTFEMVSSMNNLTITSEQLLETFGALSVSISWSHFSTNTLSISNFSPL